MFSHTPQTQKIKTFLAKNWIIDLVSGTGIYVFLLGVGFVLFSLPFSIHFKPFVSGIGVLCSPAFLTKIGKIGPFLFEAEHCQHSPFWQLLILYGFFTFFVLSLLIFLQKKKQTETDTFIMFLILLSYLLILIPEFLYAKDIYPAHYRANTMFKMVFQSFIMLSLVSGYSIFRIVASRKQRAVNAMSRVLTGLWMLAVGILLVGVFVYPYFAVMSYYNNLTNYQGIDGTTYLKNLYPSDYKAITWINAHITGQPVILEAQSDSYTDYARISSNTGLPTVLGWTVHEWLWRGEYDYPVNDPKKNTDKTPYYPAPRIGEVQMLYESPSIDETKRLIDKYKISYVYLGDLERQKYPAINEAKWQTLGNAVFQDGTTKIYKVTE